MQQIQAVIFDMDGLMVDTEPMARRSWEMALAEFGLQLSEPTFNQMIGLRRLDSALLVVEVLDLDLSPDKLLERKEFYSARLMANGIPVMPGLDRLVEVLKQRKMPWGVATSSPISYAERILKNLNLEEDCQAIASGEEVQNGKPAPDVYLLAAERLAVTPERCLALEDSVPGVKAAVTAGMLTVAVPGDHADAEAFGLADYIFPSLNDVADGFGRLLSRLPM
jgi:beta-phosphoglucomutase family hydrolase